MGHVEVLDRPECRRLLAAGGVGRISVANGAAPVIRPVTFALDGDRIVFRTGESALWRAGRAVPCAGRVRDRCHRQRRPLGVERDRQRPPQGCAGG